MMKQEKPQTHAAKPGDETQLTRLNQEFITAVKTSDVAWFESKLAPDFLNSNADGSLSDRAGFLKRVASPIQVGDFAVHDVLIRMFGTTAIIHGRTSFTHPDGQTGRGRYTDVWARHANRWLCIAADVSRG